MGNFARLRVRFKEDLFEADEHRLDGMQGMGKTFAPVSGRGHTTGSGRINPFYPFLSVFIRFKKSSFSY
jgi:hypothetical protein